MPLQPLWFCLLTLSLGLFAPTPLSGAAAETKPASKAELSLVLVSHEEQISATFPKAETLSAWLKPIIENCSATLAKEKKTPLLLLQITLRTNEDALFEVSGKPALSSALKKALLARLQAYAGQRAVIGEVCLRLQSRQEDQPDPYKAAESFSPRLLSAEEKSLEAFEAANLATKAKLCREWALNLALPLVARGASGANPKFEGVFKMGRLLQLTDFSQPFNPEALTYSNADYWRGLMEMIPGNHQVAVIPILLYMANGELDKARQLLMSIAPFADKASFGAYLEAGAMKRLSSLNKTLSSRVNEGIALHDKGSYAKAIAIYRKVLGDYPRSAWARYELFYSEIHKSGTEKMIEQLQEGRLWPEAAKEIYTNDPLYSTQFSGSKGVDKGALLARLQIKTLGSGKTPSAEEVYGCYTDSALKLGCHGYAAQLYWLTFTSKLTLVEPSAGDRPAKKLDKDAILDRYLYCLHTLGVDSLVANFKGDRRALFETFDRDLEAFRKQ